MGPLLKRNLMTMTKTKLMMTKTKLMITEPKLMKVNLMMSTFPLARLCLSRLCSSKITWIVFIVTNNTRHCGLDDD